jgi:hypothetical protein
VRSYWEHVEETHWELGKRVENSMETMDEYIIMESKRGKKKHFNPIKDFCAHDLMDFTPCLPHMFQGWLLENDTK